MIPRNATLRSIADFFRSQKAGLASGFFTGFAVAAFILGRIK